MVEVVLGEGSLQRGDGHRRVLNKGARVVEARVVGEVRPALMESYRKAYGIASSETVVATMMAQQ